MNADQAKKLLERVAALERNERNYAQDILSLNRENNDLKRRVETNERRYKELKDKFDGIGNVGAGVDTGNTSAKTVGKLKRKCEVLEKKVKNLQKQVKAFGQIQQTIDNLNKMTTVLNRAMIQGHQKSPPASKGNVDGDLRKHVVDLQKWKKEKTNEDERMLERIRSVARQTACIDAIQEQLTILTSWKDEKETEDQQKSKRFDETLKKINANFSVVQESLKEKPQESSTSLTKHSHQLDQTIDSIFCADLGTQRKLVQQEVIKVNQCAAALRSNTGPFDSQSGSLKPNHDGIYNLGWKIHQKGDGKIRFIMAIDGMEGRIYLGSTFEAGGICSGTLIVPLKKEQRVWIEAKRVAGPDAQVYGCNFMGWLMELNPLGTLERITNLQQSLFSSIVTECQHL